MNFKEFETETKLRGGYYTPQNLSDYILKWIKNNNPTTILEPSCGDGVFLKSIESYLVNSKVTAIELLKEEADKAKKKSSVFKKNKFKIVNTDFLSWAIPKIKKNTSKFDAVVGNPPFIRYQYLPKEFQKYSETIFSLKKCKFTKHTNAWVPFIISAISLLRSGGRLGMVVPSEIMHVTHANSLRKFLEEECKKILIIDPKELWFENTLQGAVIILAEKKINLSDTSLGLIVKKVKGMSFLKKDPEKLLPKKSNSYRKNLDQKWMKALISKECVNLISRLYQNKQIKKFKDVASVDVGIVTGANNFFLVNDEIVEKNKLQEYTHPMFGRSDHCPGIIYDKSQHSENKLNGKPTNFLFFNDSSVEKKPHIKKYLDLGVSQKLDKRYKCRIRKHWYMVPSVYKTEIGMLKRSHNSPKLILNKLGAYTTDTSYRIKALTISNINLVYSFVNTLTSLSAEIEGRHYGGGVLELVPSEIEELFIPILPDNLFGINDLKRLDKLVKTKKSSEVLQAQSELILSKVGISKSEQKLIYKNWKLLKDRRQRN